MSPKRSNIRMNQRIDILQRVTTTNDMGQKSSVWVEDVTGVPCFTTPSGASASIRTQPTIEQADYLTIYFAYDTEIQYTSRLRNVESITGESIYPETFQVIQIDKHMSFSGKVQYIQVTAKSVIE